jgi:hypothetical protein
MYQIANRNYHHSINNNVFIIVALLLMIELVSSLMNDINQLIPTIRYLITWSGFLCILFLSVAINRTEKDVANAFTVLIIGMIIVSILAVLKVYGIINIGISMMNTMEFMSGVPLATKKTTAVPMSLGLFAMLVCASSSMLITGLIEHKNINRIFYLLAISSILVGVFISQSRNTFLSLTLTTLFILSAKTYGRNILGPALAVMFLIVAVNYLTGVFSYLSYSSYETVQARMQQNWTGISIFLSNPIIGCGSDAVNQIGWRQMGNPIHNFFVHILASKGIVGAILVFSLWLFNIGQVRKLYENRDSFKIASWWLVMGGSFVGMFTAMNFFPAESIKIQFLITGLCLVLNNKVQSVVKVQLNNKKYYRTVPSYNRRLS